jgi:hypothetical protein
MCDSPFDYIKTPTSSIPITIPVKFCFCISTGSMTIGINVDTCDILANDKLIINYAIHNESTCRIKALELWIEEYVWIKASGHTDSNTSKFCKTRITSDKLYGIEKVTGKDITQINDEIESVVIELTNKKNEITFQIPNSIRPTYSGSIGRVSYTLVGKICTPFLVDDPIFRISLRTHCNTDVTKASFNGQVPEKETDYDLPTDWSENSISEKEVNLDASPTSITSNDITCIEYLKESLSKSNQWSETYIISDWIQKGNVNELLNNSNLEDIYRLIKSDYSYIVISEYFSNALSGKMTCKLICSAASDPNSNDNKVSILSTFASKCIDKTNAKSTFETLDLDNYSLSMVLLKYQ